jgi:hypothetical protein
LTVEAAGGSSPRPPVLAPSANARTPGLLDGYGFNQFVAYDNTSAAVFGKPKRIMSKVIGGRSRIVEL